MAAAPPTLISSIQDVAKRENGVSVNDDNTTLWSLLSMKLIINIIIFHWIQFSVNTLAQILLKSHSVVIN